MSSLKACHCCGLIHRVPTVDRCQTAQRAHDVVRRLPDRGTWRSRPVEHGSRALGAFVLYWPAIFCRFCKLKNWESESSLLGGTIELIRHGNWLVGGIVFLFSIVFPLAKIVLLLELSLLEMLHRRHKAFTLRLMEHLGRWSMMDVMLLAFMVMLVKLGDLVEFHLGPAIVAFILCVAMSLVASMSFDPHAIWEEVND